MMLVVGDSHDVGGGRRQSWTVDVGGRRQSWPLMLVVGDSHGH